MLEAEVGQCDAVLLAPLSEDAFLHNLHVRFKRDIIYTYVGNMLISVNPCRQLPLYSAELVRSYVARAPYQMPPHVYSIAATAYRWVRDRNESQCIVVTGESGAGKTEAARVCLQCAVVAGGGAGAARAAAALTAAGTLLEALGNAATHRNHNASRFGKHLDIEFDYKGDPLGGHITHYLLEKSRVTRLQEGDRNFHVFYQLLAGADVHLLKLLKLQRSASWYRVLRGGSPAEHACSEPLALSPHRRPRSRLSDHSPALRDDRDHFAFTKTAMETLGFSGEETTDVFRLLAFILKLGNVEFVPATNIDGTMGCSVDNEYELYEACEIVGVNSEELLVALGASSEELDAGDTVLGAAEASAARDRLLPALYGRLFTWAINRVNAAIKPKNYGKRNTMGILDLYGFESLPTNSLEQLLINYANERVQSALVSVTLRREQDEYSREHIEWQRIQYFDNEPICELIEAPGHGVLSLVNECASRGAGSALFLQRLQQCRAGHQHLITVPPAHFQLHHFAGTVTYDASGFVEKSSDALPLRVTSCLHAARNTLMKELFPEGRLASPRRPAPLGCRLRVGVCALVRRLCSGPPPRLVRCLRADDARRPRHFDAPLVRHQVRTQGIMEMLALRRAGHCEAMCARALLARYSLLRPRGASPPPPASAQAQAAGPRGADDPVRAARALLRALPIPGAEFTYGRTKVFIRSPRTVFELEAMRSARVSALVGGAQRAWRRHRTRQLVRRRHRAQRVIARAWRRHAGSITVLTMFVSCRANDIAHYTTGSSTVLKMLASCRAKLSTRANDIAHYTTMRRRVMSMQQEKRVMWAVTTIQKHYVQWMRRRYLTLLWSRLPSSHLSPLCGVWPPAPCARLLPADRLLRHIHHRWRCSKYRLNFDQTARNRMREKVTASILFKDRKQNYPRSVGHPFVGDYVRLRASAQWRRTCSATPPSAASDHYVVFADVVNKVARSSGKLCPALVVVSTGALLVLDARSLRVKRRVPAPAIYRLSLSPYADDVLVVHVRACPLLEAEEAELTSQCSSRDGGDTTGCLFGSEGGSRRKGDLVLQTCHVLEMATKLFLVVQNAVGKPPHVNISTEFEANFGQQIVSISFKLAGLSGLEPLRVVRRGSRMDVLI